MLKRTPSKQKVRANWLRLKDTNSKLPFFNHMEKN